MATLTTNSVFHLFVIHVHCSVSAFYARCLETVIFVMANAGEAERTELKYLEKEHAQQFEASDFLGEAH